MGAVRTRTLRNTMAGSVFIYVPALYALSALWGNHGIWAALTVFMAARSILLSLAWPALRASVNEREADIPGRPIEAIGRLPL